MSNRMFMRDKTSKLSGTQQKSRRFILQSSLFIMYCIKGVIMDEHEILLLPSSPCLANNKP